MRPARCPTALNSTRILQRIHKPRELPRKKRQLSALLLPTMRQSRRPSSSVFLDSLLAGSTRAEESVDGWAQAAVVGQVLQHAHAGLRIRPPAGPAQTPLTLVDLQPPSAFPTVIVGRVFLLFLLLLRPSMLTLAYAGLMPPRLACSPAGSSTAPSKGAGRRRVRPIRGAAAPPLLLLAF
jgi:hypothetical protein